MPVYHLSSKPAITAAVATGRAGIVAERVIAGLAQRGYVLGPGMVAVLADGSVEVDTDRDPTPDWELFDPSTPTAAETAEATRRQQFRDVHDLLRAGNATSRQTQGVVAWLLKQHIPDLPD
jgi:hypothetical protein